MVNANESGSGRDARIHDSTPEILEFLSKEYAMDAILVAIESDISLDGEYSSRWLVSDGSLLVVIRARDGSFSPEEHMELASIEEIQVKEFSGCGSLVVRDDNHSRELVRFSSSKVPRFEAAKAVLLSLTGARDREDASGEEPARPSSRSIRPRRGLRLYRRFRPKMNVLWRLLSYVEPYRKWAAVLVFVILASSGLRLIPPYFMKILLDDVFGSGQGDAGRLVTIVVLLAIVGAAGTGVNIARTRISAWLGSKISTDLRSQLYRRIQFQSMSFFDRKTTGAVVANVTQDTRTLHTFCVDIAGNSIVHVLLLIGIGVMLFHLNALLAFLVFVPVPVVVLLSRRFLTKLMARFRSLWQGWMHLYRIIDSSISGIRLVKAFGQEPKEIERFERRNVGLFGREWEANKAVSLYFPVVTLAMRMGTFVIWLVGGLAVMAGSMTIGSLIAFIAYTAMIYGPLQALATIGQRISGALTSTERVFEVLDTMPDVRDAEDAIRMKTMKGEVAYKDVSFGYDKHRPVLHNIALNIKPGEMIGLVGRSGAGKTTMMNLLCRFYDADKGSVQIDGIDVRKIKMVDLHRHIAVVPQDTFLFEGTISENICYARPDAPLDEIIGSAVASSAHDFVMGLKDGYDSHVGERGQKLSRGQRQMISIARAILSNPSILILDEPTSSVDIESEDKIQMALSRLTKGKTTFSVAHRLSTLRNCDRLLVLKDGRIVESGTHEQLMQKKDGIYRNLVESYARASRTTVLDV